MKLYKRIETDKLKEIQEELIAYDFFSKTPDVESDDSPLEPTRRSGAMFYGIPDLPKLKEFLNSVVLTEHITHYHVINLISQGQSDIHTDEDGSPWALNIPILNCETSYTAFYDDDKNEIDRITLDVPYFLNIAKYHQIVNTGNSNRIVITFRFSGKDFADIVK
jgi:hypothetical protein